MTIQQVEDKVTTFRDGRFISPIFDYTQTHAIYGVLKEDVKEVKAKLKELGFNKFRNVRNGAWTIICFNSNNLIVSRDSN